MVGAARLCACGGAAAAAVQPKVSLSFTSKHSCFRVHFAAVAVPVLPWPACRNSVWTCDPVCSAVTLWACCLLFCVYKPLCYTLTPARTPSRAQGQHSCVHTLQEPVQGWRQRSSSSPQGAQGSQRRNRRSRQAGKGQRQTGVGGSSSSSGGRRLLDSFLAGPAAGGGRQQRWWAGKGPETAQQQEGGEGSWGRQRWRQAQAWLRRRGPLEHCQRTKGWSQQQAVRYSVSTSSFTLCVAPGTLTCWGLTGGLCAAGACWVTSGAVLPRLVCAGVHQQLRVPPDGGFSIQGIQGAVRVLNPIRNHTVHDTRHPTHSRGNGGCQHRCAEGCFIPFWYVC